MNGLSALSGDSWVQEEAIFGLLGVIAVVAAGVALRRPADRGDTVS